MGTKSTFRVISAEIAVMLLLGCSASVTTPLSGSAPDTPAGPNAGKGTNPPQNNTPTSPETTPVVVPTPASSPSPQVSPSASPSPAPSPTFNPPAPLSSVNGQFHLTHFFDQLDWSCSAGPPACPGIIDTLMVSKIHIDSTGNKLVFGDVLNHSYSAAAFMAAWPASQRIASLGGGTIGLTDFAFSPSGLAFIFRGGVSLEQIYWDPGFRVEKNGSFVADWSTSETTNAPVIYDSGGYSANIGPVVSTLQMNLPRNLHQLAKVAFSADSKIVIAAYRNAACRWDVATGTELGCKTYSDVSKYGVPDWATPAISANYIAWTSDGGDSLRPLPQALVVWDLQSGREHVNQAVTGDLSAANGGGAVISPDQLSVIVMVQDGSQYSLAYFDVNSAKQTRSDSYGICPAGHDLGSTLQFDSTGQMIVAQCPDSVILLKYPTLEPVDRVEFDDRYVTAVGYSADGRVLAVGTAADLTGYRGELRVFQRN